MLLKKNLKRLTLFLLVFFPILFISFQSQAAQPLRILILPFDINAAQDFDFLKHGIQDMLESRLGEESTITLIEAAPLSGAKALESARAADADYLVTGSITVLGNRISTDARFIDARQSKVLLKFNRFGNEIGDALEHIDQFAAQVNTEILPQQQAAIAAAMPAPAKVKPQAAPQPAPSTAAKETTTSAPTPVVTTTPPAEQKIVEGKTVAPSSVTPAPLSGDFWKSQPFDKPIKGLAIGDVYGDNRNEAVLFSNGQLLVYRLQDGKLKKLAAVTNIQSDTFLALDVADINQNGKAEIFLTALNPQDKLDSTVLEWDGNVFAKVISHARWYYRVIPNPAGQEILLGQKRGILTTGDAYGDVNPSSDLFLAGIYELRWQSITYQPIRRLELPDWINVFGFTYVNLTGTDPEMVAAFSAGDRLRLLNADGTLAWESRERYGGSTIFLEYPSAASSNRGGRRMDRRYLPQRIQGADLDRDGRQELVVTKNLDPANRLLGRTREYNNCQLESLVWNQIAMTQQWNTDLISGYISDYAVRDLNNDGHPEVVFTIVSRARPLLGKKRSFVIVLDRSP